MSVSTNTVIDFITLREILYILKRDHMSVLPVSLSSALKSFTPRLWGNSWAKQFSTSKTHNSIGSNGLSFCDFPLNDLSDLSKVKDILSFRTSGKAKGQMN